MRTWVLPSATQNWSFSLTHMPPIWGLTDGKMNTAYFDQLEVGDPLLMYVTGEVGGFVGLAHMREKYVDRQTLYWPDEKAAGKVIYPLRFRMELDIALPMTYWQALKVPRTVVPYTIRGFSPLAEDLAVKVMGQIRSWTAPNQKSRPTLVTPDLQGTGIRETPTELQPAHDDLKTMLVDIGKFQNYVTAVEYEIAMDQQSMRLDVVWKRELEGVPTFAFEVELSGNVERAAARLKRAYERWNSRPYIIVPASAAQRVRNLYPSTSSSFERTLRSCSPEQVKELHAVKTRLRSMERDLGLIA